ncbi:Malonyl CoA-acyl carrier protein transacylase [BD1-7 clade bacterium]|uniref:Malonyl CoA-acyl carrier protein transacylase n=1 Tax=BD1-7 clade bacterium TaxID=2029982 RepID=A0A5S9QL85_9GAMM|nr:Malonyl CoA-acyl carrier protein transacylase [BD1-7 clade bacterium]CAA0116011.1 Malonyl CoA-acyl carrier protein transacylase [BD1-7 clade bacterium]CAA0119666.1 Malonyl CoA-acyl carrier protein transacylase [BD1-7 clade bacterium]
MSNSSLAFVFPGQGSQKISMLSDAAEAFPIIKDVFAEASDALDYDMWDLIQNGEQDAINLTEKTQPILMTSSVALWNVWKQENGAMPAVMAGHSLGEFTALVCAESLAFSDALKLVRARGQFMQSAVPVGIGAMAAIIGVDDQAIVDICADVAGDECVQAVNFNSPGQVVIAGHAGAVDRAIVKLKEAGAKRAMPLPVSAPFHTDLMRPAGEKLAVELENIAINTPAIPVIHNVHAQTEVDPEKIKGLLIEQIYSPVKWTSCVQTMVSQGTGHLIECGPGKVLSGLAKRIHKSLTASAIEQPDTLRQQVADLSA